MGDLILKGGTSGQITLTPTAIAGTNTLTLPAKTGNIITSADSGTVTGTMLASATIAQSNIASGVGTTGPYFAAYGSALVSTSNNTATKITYNTVETDTDSGFNTSSNRYVAPVAGIYMLAADVSFAANATGYCQVYLYKNGGLYRQGFACPNSNIGPDVSASWLANLAVNDYVEIWVQQNSGGALNAGSTNSTRAFMGCMIRKAP